MKLARIKGTGVIPMSTACSCKPARCVCEEESRFRAARSYLYTASARTGDSSSQSELREPDDHPARRNDVPGAASTHPSGSESRERIPNIFFAIASPHRAGGPASLSPGPSGLGQLTRATRLSSPSGAASRFSGWGSYSSRRPRLRIQLVPSQAGLPVLHTDRVLTGRIFVVD